MVAPSVIRTLLVDENEDFLLGAELWILERPDMVVVGKARTGPEALTAIETHQPDLVIMDGVLPQLDGFRVARMIKSRPNPPVVVIATFAASKAARQEALAAGADGFIPKDEFAEGLERVIDELMGPRISARGAATTREKPIRRGSRTEQDL